MLKAARDQKEGKIIYCEAKGCNAWTKFGGYAWRKLWRMVWVENINTSLSACSIHCANKIKAGNYQMANEQPEPIDAPMKAEQMRLF